MSAERRGIGTFLKLRAILHPVDKAPVRRKISDAEDSYTQSELHPRKLHPFDVELFRGMLASRSFLFFTRDITITDIVQLIVGLIIRGNRK